ncbi:MAG: hypothetical protein ACJAYC_003439 [Halieaceae bacterium]|jgi:hypothetical protein
MSDTVSYQINQPGVVQEKFENEIVIVNLETGHYFSTSGVGEFIWTQLINGFPVGEILPAVALEFDIDSDTAESSGMQFISDVLINGLLIPRSSEPIPVSADEAFSAPETKKVFLPPVLERHTDMQDLLLLDPIHDVDDSGWPNKLPQ